MLNFDFSHIIYQKMWRPAPFLPLRSLYDDTVCRHPRAIDIAVGCSEKGGGNPTLYVAAFFRVGIFPFRREASGYAFKRSLHLHAEEAVHQDDEGGELEALMEARLQVIIILLLLFHMETLPQ